MTRQEAFDALHAMMERAVELMPGTPGAFDVYAEMQSRATQAISVEMPQWPGREAFVIHILDQATAELDRIEEVVRDAE